MAFIFSYINHNSSFKQKLIKSLLCKDKDCVSEQLLSRVVYAVSFVFFLFGQHQTHVNSTKTHPSPMTRQTFAMSYLISMLTEYTDIDDEEQLILRVQNAATKAENSWNQLGFSFGETPDLDELPRIVKRLNRFDQLAAYYLADYQWARFVR